MDTSNGLHLQVMRLYLKTAFTQLLYTLEDFHMKIYKLLTWHLRPEYT